MSTAGTGPGHPVRLEVEPHLLRHRARLVRHLHRRAPPARKPPVVERRRIPRHHHRARQPPQQPEQLVMVLLRIVVPVAPRRLARAVQVRRVAVHQLRPVERIPSEELVAAAAHQLHRVVALEPLQRPPVQVDPDVPQRPRLAPHDRPAPKVRLNVHAVRRHQRDQGLAQPSRRLRSKVRVDRGASSYATVFFLP